MTNLAIGLIISLGVTSLVLNVSYLLSDSDDRGTIASTHGFGVDGRWGSGRGRAGSIEATINRDPRIERLDHLVMVPGHAIYTGSDPGKVEEDGEWVLEPMQRDGSVRTFIKHVEEGVRVVKEDLGALLVFSG